MDSFIVGFLSAEQLGIPEDYRAALIKAYEEMASGRVVHVENYDPYDRNEPDEVPAGKIGWNMGIWNCGTACCIGGLAEKLSPTVKFDYGTEIYQDLYELFYPNSISAGPGIDYERITIPQGLKALLNYLTTGKADWNSIPGIPPQ